MPLNLMILGSTPNAKNIFAPSAAIFLFSLAAKNELT